MMNCPYCRKRMSGDRYENHGCFFCQNDDCSIDEIVVYYKRKKKNSTAKSKSRKVMTGKAISKRKKPKESK